MNAPLSAAYALFGLFWVSWMMAAAWTRRTAARPVAGSQSLYTVMVIVGYVLLFSRTNEAFPSAIIGWLMTALCAAGYAFCWWARIHLGSLWSGTVTVKDDHHVVDTGPYGLVRHPIYTGLILAAFGLAGARMSVLAFVGAGLCTWSFYIKARLEERFLRQELGAEAYDAYAARIPMLIPFWPK